MIVNSFVLSVTEMRMVGMENCSSDGSSDDSFSYKNTAKRAFEIAKKKIAAVKPPAEPKAVVDLSSDSEGSCKKGDEASARLKEDLKRKRLGRCANVESKRLRGLIVTRARAARVQRNEDIVAGLSTDSDSDSIGLPLVNPTPCLRKSKRRIHARRGRNRSLADTARGLNSDSNSDIAGTPLVISSACLTSKALDDSNPEAIVNLSDSSDVELLAAPDVVVVSEDEERSNENEMVSVKISWKLQPIQKFQLRRHQKFKVLMEHFSKLEEVPLQQIVIYGGKDNCRLIEPYDTPDTVGLTVTDVLEGGVLVNGGQVRAQRSRGLAQHEGGEGITVRVQMEGVHSFPIQIGAQQRMHVLLVKVAEQMEVSVTRVKLSLDGEAINSESIAKDLGLEEGDVLDLHLL